MTRSGWVGLWLCGTMAAMPAGMFAIALLFDRHEYIWHMVFGWQFLIAANLVVGAIVLKRHRVKPEPPNTDATSESNCPTTEHINRNAYVALGHFLHGRR